MCLPVLVGGHSEFGLENRTKVLPMPKTGSFGDRGQGQIGSAEQLDCTVKSDPLNLVMHRTLENLLKLPVQRAAGDGYAFGNVLDPDRLRCVFPNKAQCGSKIPVVDGQYVSGSPYDDFGRFKQQFLLTAGNSSHKCVQHFSRTIPHLIWNRNDTRKRRRTEFARHLVVIDAKDRDFFRNQGPDPMARFEDSPPQHVVCRHDRSRRRELGDPGS